LEDLLAWNLDKYLDDLVVLHKQFEVETICGKFRVDLAAVQGTRTVGFECDGKDFHNAFRDDWRDAMILGTGAIDLIYRFRGCDLIYHMNDCLYVVSRLDKSLFSQRGFVNLNRLASPAAKAISSLDECTYSIPVVYPRSPYSADPLVAKVVRNVFSSSRCKRDPLREYYEYVLRQGGGDLDLLIAEYMAALGWPSP